MKFNPLHLLLLFFLTSWKFNLLSTGTGAESGIRLDDILIVLMFIYIVFREGKLPLSGNLKTIYIFTVVAITSTLFNTLALAEGSILTSILFAARSFEYALFFFLGYFLIKERPEKQHTVLKIFDIYFYYLLAIIILQNLEVLGSVSNFRSNTRLSGNLGGPWELAQIASFFSLYYLLLWNKNKAKSIILTSLSIYMLLESGSRITLAGTLVTLILLAIYHKILNWKSIIPVLVLTATMGILLTSIGSLINKDSTETGISKRFESLLKSDITEDTANFFNSIPSLKSQQEFLDYNESYVRSQLGQFEGDASAYIRFSRWILAYKVWGEKSTIQILIGNGPGYYGPSLDGNYIRILFETGILGLAVFLLIFFNTIKKYHKLRLKQSFDVISGKYIFNSLLFFYSISLLITAFFIDILYTYKAMMIFWTLQGLAHAEKKSKTERQVANDNHSVLR
jgi:hypothetical protein